MNKKGFTLIELLVVIAIIGILATIVLSSLDTARSKSNDVAVKSDLDNSRAAAELFYDGVVGLQSYTSLCDSSKAGSIFSMVDAARVAAGLGTAAARNTLASATQAVCNDSTNAWAAQVPLKTAGLGTWCVDSTGVSKNKTGFITAATYSCTGA